MLKIVLGCILLLLVCGILSAKEFRAGKTVRLLLPEKIYAAPGIECNIYFDNIVTVINPANYVFDVICEAGRNDAKRWRFTPGAADAGKEYAWTVRVYDGHGMIAEGRTVVSVAPELKAEKKLSLLLIGASQTAAEGYPEHLLELMRQEPKIEFQMVGTNSGNYHKPVPGGVAHEGYGGWGWNSFFLRLKKEESDANDGLDPARPWITWSRFMFRQNGRWKFDFREYCVRYNGGKYPDTIVIMLGINNIFLCKSDREVDQVWNEHIYPYMKQMAEAFRKAVPEVHIAFSSLTPGASQDAFGRSYHCRQSRWRWRLNLDRYHRKLFRVVDELKVGLVPVYASIDGEHGFPTVTEPVNQRSSELCQRQSNALHPSPAGYAQIGDAIYCYLLHCLTAPHRRGQTAGPTQRTCRYHTRRNPPDAPCTATRAH